MKKPAPKTGSSTLTVSFTFSHHQMVYLSGRSRLLRENPRRRWTQAELREHCRAAIQSLVQEHMDKDTYKEEEWE